LEAGRLWKARDRATGLFSTRPTDQDVLALVAEVYFRMGDLPRAGALWYLTDCSGDPVDQAMAAMRERYPMPSDLASALPIRDGIEAFPGPVQDRLHALQRAVKEQTGRDWVPAPRRSKGLVEAARPSRLADLGCVLALTLCLVVFVLGLVSVVSWLVSHI
jgi:hypothetical protein